MEQQLQTANSQVATPTQNSEAMEQFRIACQNFTWKLNSSPKPESIGETADGRAKTVAISHIEMTLDEYFFGLWETENFKWAVITNEVVGSIDLVVLHPVTGQKIRRSGAGAIQIMVDAAPADVKNNKQAKNEWALNPMNKKSNALDMGFPKLKTECIKNAAQSLGKLFGRDLNRKIQDNFNGLIQPKQTVPFEDLQTLYELKKEALPPEDKDHAERIIKNMESNSYNKLYKQLQSL